MRARNLSDAERRDWLRLSLAENVGPVTFRNLLATYGAASDALAALPELSARGGLRRPLRVPGLADVEARMEKARDFGARYVVPGEPGYSELLRHIDGPPPFLCIKGHAELAQRECVGIVGSRNASALGRKFTRQLAAELGEAGRIIVSGLARGIDTAAHEASLATGTVAVVAGGIDVIYPPENEALQKAIAEQGLIVSEMLLGTVPKAEHFPRRNRIISGLSRVIVVVEAALRSGSLITARLAAEQGRDVYAVPGSPLDPRCEGANKLIRNGATLLTSARDILDELIQPIEPVHDMFFEPGDPPPTLSERDRAAVYALLAPSPIDVDDLVRESGFSPSAVAAILLELELAGRITRHPRGGVSVA